ncbi:GtrA family protein [Desemzia sp. FAM 23991]|uniref:GtrA family protein n=1 Tax=unclassified Desemzia TaxID=2685243 RepID=UPI003887F09D
MRDTVIVIPSLDPDVKLLNLLASIRKKETKLPILLINDGSSSEYDAIFKRAEKYVDQLLIHKENKGKGAVLKTAMQFILKEMPEAEHMVTIDSDGQHSYADMVSCIQLAKEYPDALILGTRKFDKKVPFRSKFGNVLTRNVLRLSIGLDIEDTQTGLRVIPKSFMPQLIEVAGERFEYETNMLIETKKQQRTILCQPIETIYIAENASSHFRVVADSVAIYGVFIKYLLSSVSSFIVDVVVYAVLIHLLDQVDLSSIFIASIAARLVSAVFNYYVNREYVFSQQNKNSFYHYFGLVCAQIIVSALLVYMVHSLFIVGDTVYFKIMIDSLLFFLSYYIQKNYIFKR